MKPLQLSEDVLPIDEFTAQASSVFRRVRNTQRPVLITENGRPAAVLISPEEFDTLRERERFLAAIEEGLADADAGRVIDDEALDRELEADLGSLPRE